MYLGSEERLDRWSCIRVCRARQRAQTVQICPKTNFHMIVAIPNNWPKNQSEGYKYIFKYKWWNRELTLSLSDLVAQSAE